MTKDEALKMAIECLEYHNEQGAWGCNLEGTIVICKEALEQPNLTYEAGFTHGYDAHLADYKEQPTQEPMIVKQDNGMVLKLGYEDLPNGTAFYTTPPSREWQSLSDDDISYTWAGFAPDAIDFARAIEAKLKEKNA